MLTYLDAEKICQEWLNTPIAAHLTVETLIKSREALARKHPSDWMLPDGWEDMKRTLLNAPHRI